MYCNQCGSVLPNDVRFCTRCGAEQLASGQIASEISLTPRVLGAAELEIRLMSGMTSDQRSMFQYQMGAVRKSPGTSLVLSFFGLSRLYLDQLGLFILQLLLCFVGVGLLWAILDIFTAKRRTNEYNEKKGRQIAAALGLNS